MKIKTDSIIFDMDGVLVDVSQSYRLAIEKTVNFFLVKRGITAKATQKDVNALKGLVGFNNDWDTSFVLIDLLSKGVEKEKFSKMAKPLKLAVRKTREYQKMKDIFQTFYLGNLLFEKIEKRKAPLDGVDGFILKESCLISKKLLDKLLNMNLKLGIATSRPRQEALFAIKKFGLQKFFSKQCIITQEDTKREKPDPAPLLEAKGRLKAKNPIYIGDSLSDVLAASRAKMFCVYVGKEKLGDIQINNINQLLKVLL